MHIALAPLTNVLAAVLPLDAAVAVDFVVEPRAVVRCAVCPEVSAFALLKALGIGSQVACAAWPSFPA
eukprot:CAMPEP_0185573876 /NCGR_PEP_ID=MMETSP0434-20130131/5468_1 /TAXON_ID=626734 ORGANISM="Favella taraikaensis, Strain Fe Narragansett Bay" /NCGR_SAMPLE_ID=MMETSP0434 /ASSEMBLY_ACC=CAM_ASM_000379 /LENGTH=67 /DNA_ID=CAMNT_0028190245 /DNA_START=476 /DNA_END=679 /DNA_ORIENTATION=-